MDLEVEIRRAVVRTYRAAGIRLPEHQTASLARIYAEWAGDADAGVVQRLERALALSLGIDPDRLDPGGRLEDA